MRQTVVWAPGSGQCEGPDGLSDLSRAAECRKLSVIWNSELNLLSELTTEKARESERQYLSLRERRRIDRQEEEEQQAANTKQRKRKESLSSPPYGETRAMISNHKHNEQKSRGQTSNAIHPGIVSIPTRLIRPGPLHTSSASGVLAAVPAACTREYH